MMPDPKTKLRECELKALKALAGYKFIMFGYWAALWVHWRPYAGSEPSPFRPLVHMARRLLEERS